MKKFIGICFFFLFLAPLSLMARLEIIKLNYARPESIVNIVQKLFQGTVSVTAAPMINGIIVKTEMEKDYAAIERLIRSLDRKPSILRFSIKHSGLNESITHNAKIKLGSKGRFNQSNTTEISRSNGVRNITAIEFAKAALTDETLKVYTLPTWYGPESTVITTTRGLKISGHVASSNTVIVEIWYSQGDFNETEQLLTSLEVPIGEWFSIGGNTEKRVSKTPDKGFQVGATNSSIEVHRSTNSGFIQSQYLIKVDIIQKQ